jgi:hypothetical protein
MVQSDISSEIYTGNNSTTVPYPIPFYFFHDEDLLVSSINSLGTETVLQLNTDYIVTGAGNQNGGSLKTTFAVPLNWKLRIERIVEPTQLTSYQEGDSFPAKSHEQALDKLTMLVQQALRQGGGGGGGGGRAWTDDAERALTTPGFIGQIGFQVNNATIYYAQSMSTGDWKQAIFDNTSAAAGQLPVFSTHTHLTNQVLDGVATLAGGVLGATPRPAGNLVGTTEPQTLTNKILQGAELVAPTGISKADVGLGNVDNTSDAQKNVAPATLSNKTLQSPVINSPTGLHPADVGLGNVDNTSDANKPVSTAQATALAGKEDKVSKGQPSGYASLDSTAKVPLIQLPESILGANVYQGTWNAATNTPTIPAAALANKGYYYVVNVAGTTNIDGTNSWAPGDWIISNGTIWQKVANIDSVTSVNAKTGIVVLNKGDIGLANVDNTADSAKPVSTAQQTALNLKEDKANKGVASGYASLDGTGKVPAAQLPPDAVTSVATKTGAVTLVKADVGLGNVDNTSDATKNAAAVTLTNKTIDGANNTLNVRLGSDVSGNLPVARLNGGSGAGTGTFWRGDGSWSAPAGGGDVTGPAGAVAGELATYANSTGKLLGRTTLPSPQTNMVLGDTTQGSNPATSIIVPSFVNHPDGIFSGTPSALDDHFDGTVLNAKWTNSQTASIGGPVFLVSGSRLSLGGYSPSAADGATYLNYVVTPLPNANDFTVIVRLDAALTTRVGVSGSQSFVDIRLFNTTSNIGCAYRFRNAAGVINFGVYGGTGVGTSVISQAASNCPKYLRLTYTASTRIVGLAYSDDGNGFLLWFNVPAASSGFTAGILPQRLELVTGSVNNAAILVHFDWVKFTNP